MHQPHFFFPDPCCSFLCCAIQILHFLPKVNVLDRRTVQDEENEENVGIEFTVEKLVDHEVPEISALAKNVG